MKKETTYVATVHLLNFLLLSLFYPCEFVCYDGNTCIYLYMEMDVLSSIKLSILL